MGRKLKAEKPKRKNYKLIGIVSKNIKVRRDGLEMSAATMKLLTGLNPEEYESGENDMVLTSVGLFAENLATSASRLLEEPVKDKKTEAKKEVERFERLIKALNKLIKEKNKEIENLKLQIKNNSKKKV